jgi:hypothetical protein
VARDLLQGADRVHATSLTPTKQQVHFTFVDGNL